MDSEQTIFLLRDTPIIEINPEKLTEHALSKELFENTSTDEYNALKKDIESRGIQDPLHVVRGIPDYLIVSGHRRARIARELGIKVPCILRMDLKEEWQIKEALIKDNLLRRHLTDYQKVRCGLELEPIEAKRAKERQGTRTDLIEEVDNYYSEIYEKGEKTYCKYCYKDVNIEPGDGIWICAECNAGLAPFNDDIIDENNIKENFPGSNKPQARDIIAREVGFGTGRQYDKAKKVYQEAPKPIKKLWQEEKLSTHAAYQKMKKLSEHEERLRNAEDAIERVEKPEGIYQVIVIDPPWNYGTKYDPNGRRVASPYPEMSLEELENIKLPYDETQCVLWLWTTNHFIHDAFHLLEKWGFEPKTILTWIKDKMGVGNWLRGKTEHCILAVKGHPVVNLTNQTTALYGKAREHSRKPEEFYKIVSELCIGRKLDYFGREKHDGFDTFGTMELENVASNME